jgi:hypothetical protein
MDPVEIMTAIQIKRMLLKQNRIAIKEKNDAPKKEIEKNEI